jgi:hypothetical protein
MVSLPDREIGEHMSGVLRAVDDGGYELATPGDAGPAPRLRASIE